MSQAPNLEWQDHQGLILATANGFKVIDCLNHGFKHIVPIPTTEELTEAYKHDYYSAEKPLYIQRYL